MTDFKLDDSAILAYPDDGGLKSQVRSFDETPSPLKAIMEAFAGKPHRWTGFDESGFGAGVAVTAEMGTCDKTIEDCKTRFPMSDSFARFGAWPSPADAGVDLSQAGPAISGGQTAPTFVIVRDFGGRLYVIPADKRREWNAWRDSDEWTSLGATPAYAVSAPADLSEIEFTTFRFG